MLELSQQRLEYLDRIPDKFYRKLVTHTYRKPGHSETHSLQLRCQGMLRLRGQLIDGRTVEIHDLAQWIETSLAEIVVDAIHRDGHRKLAEDNVAYTDELLLYLLDWLNNQSQAFDMASLDQSQPPSHNSDTQVTASGSRAPASPKLNPGSSETVQANQRGTPENEIASLDLNDSTAAQIHQQLQSINKAFALERQLGWDLSQGIRSVADLHKLLQLYETIRQSNYLQSVIRLIGRRQTRHYSTQKEPGLHPESDSEHNSGQLPDDRSVNSVTGICQGDDIARMLPSELALLSRRANSGSLKRLWHARRAERQLLNYHIRGVLPQHTPEMQPESIQPQHPGQQSLSSQGPVILCVDTSASMKGQPEHLARAITLEVMRVAHIERRDCLLFCFSGQDEIEAYDLGLEGAGWQPMLDFISRSFHGGTDMDGVLSQAIEHLNQRRWKWADFLIVSDGRFKIMDNVQIEMLKRRKPAVRIFGLQVGQWHSTALDELCHQVFRFNNAQ